MKADLNNQFVWISLIIVIGIMSFILGWEVRSFLISQETPQQNCSVVPTPSTPSQNMSLSIEVCKELLQNQSTTECPQISEEEIKKQVIQNLTQKLEEKWEKGLIPFMLYSPTTPVENRTSLTGEIMEINPTTQTIKIKIPNEYTGGDFFKWLEQPDYYIKTLKVTGSTKIVKEVLKEDPETGIPYFEEQNLSINDLKPGDLVSVTSTKVINLEKDEEITAEKIVLNQAS